MTTRLGLVSSLACLVLTPAIAVATHGSAGLPAVIESERLIAGGEGTPSGSCRVTGLVQNPSLSETVTVRLAWRGLDANGTAVATAAARVPWLRPGERRAFVSSAFVTANSADTASLCESIRYLERVDVVAEPVPVSGG